MVNTLATVAPLSGRFDEKNRSHYGSTRHATRAVRFTALMETLLCKYIVAKEVPNRTTAARLEKTHQWKSTLI